MCYVYHVYALRQLSGTTRVLLLLLLLRGLREKDEEGEEEREILDKFSLVRDTQRMRARLYHFISANKTGYYLNSMCAY